MSCGSVPRRIVNVDSRGPTLSAMVAPGNSTIASTEEAPRVMTIGCVALGFRTVTLAGVVRTTKLQPFW